MILHQHQPPGIVKMAVMYFMLYILCHIQPYVEVSFLETAGLSGWLFTELSGLAKHTSSSGFLTRRSTFAGPARGLSAVAFPASALADKALERPPAVVACRGVAAAVTHTQEHQEPSHI